MTRYQRAMQIWMLLVCAARERKTFTYGQIAEILGMGGAGVMGQFLNPIMCLCKNRQYPPLTVLVVNQDTGIPGEGLRTLEALNEDREDVFDFNWFGIKPPQVKDFRTAEQ